MTDNLQNAYRMVFNDIMNSGVNLFKGIYDAKNGDVTFMYGIEAVMEYLAYKVSEADYNNFSELFTQNIIDSEKDI